MNLVTVATHTIDMDRLSTGGVVLDVGCRDFDFANEVGCRGIYVHAFDPAPDVLDLGAFRTVTYHRAAVVGIGKEGPKKLVVAGNGSRLSEDAEFPTWSFSLKTLPFDSGTVFECVKLDCEGSEYEILLTWPGPVSKQITVEFHEHTKQGKDVHGADVYERIDGHLGQWYRKVKDDPMDTLYVLKEAP